MRFSMSEEKDTINVNESNTLIKDFIERRVHWFCEKILKSI